MRLEHLCDIDFTYRRGQLYDDLLELVVPYGTQEASLCALKRHRCSLPVPNAQALVNGRGMRDSQRATSQSL